MFHSISDFVSEWKQESAITVKMMETLTDESLQHSISPDSRTLGQIAWHLVRVIGSMTQTGLVFEKPDGEELAPASAQKIASEYKRVSEALLHAVETQWTDASLQPAENAGPEEWSNGKSLHLLIQHEVHHRGQMTILMRLAGLRPAPVYGPTREDWIEMGKEPLM